MSFLDRRSHRLYFDARGLDAAGGRSPVLFVMGLGVDADGWEPQVRALEGRFPTVVFDNRGIGRSSRVRTLDYRVEGMADDALVLLEHLGVARAHVVGVSLGGLVSQRVALRAPARVHTLTLAATFARRPGHVARYAASVVAQMTHALLLDRATRFDVGAAAARAWIPMLAGASPTPAQAALLGAMVRSSVARALRPDVVAAQLLEVLRHDHRSHLGRIRAPTQVLVGDRDVCVPVEDAEILARLIPGARLRVVRGGGHGFTLLHAEEVNAALLEFLEAHEAARPTPQPSRAP